MQQEQGEFSEWLHAMRSQQQTTATSHMSDASSWADTDSESDSDSEAHHGGAHFTFGNRARTSHKNTSKMVPSYERTAPMLIPQASRPRRRSYYMNEFEDSVPSHNNQHTSSAFHESSYAESVEDEDDPALYQNLAYFRSQNARKEATSSHYKQCDVRSRSPSPVSSTASDSDDIFDMEL